MPGWVKVRSALSPSVTVVWLLLATASQRSGIGVPTGSFSSPVSTKVKFSLGSQPRSFSVLLAVNSTEVETVYESGL